MLKLTRASFRQARALKLFHVKQLAELFIAGSLKLQKTPHAWFCPEMLKKSPQLG